MFFDAGLFGNPDTPLGVVWRLGNNAKVHPKKIRQQNVADLCTELCKEESHFSYMALRTKSVLLRGVVIVHHHQVAVLLRDIHQAHNAAKALDFSQALTSAALSASYASITIELPPLTLTPQEELEIALLETADLDFDTDQTDVEPYLDEDPSASQSFDLRGQQDNRFPTIVIDHHADALVQAARPKAFISPEDQRLWGTHAPLSATKQTKLTDWLPRASEDTKHPDGSHEGHLEDDDGDEGDDYGVENESILPDMEETGGLLDLGVEPLQSNSRPATPSVDLAVQITSVLDSVTHSPPAAKIMKDHSANLFGGLDNEEPSLEQHFLQSFVLPSPEQSQPKQTFPRPKVRIDRRTQLTSKQLYRNSSQLSRHRSRKPIIKGKQLDDLLMRPVSLRGNWSCETWLHKVHHKRAQFVELSHDSPFSSPHSNPVVPVSKPVSDAELPRQAYSDRRQNPPTTSLSDDDFLSDVGNDGDEGDDFDEYDDVDADTAVLRRRSLGNLLTFSMPWSSQKGAGQSISPDLDPTTLSPPKVHSTAPNDDQDFLNFVAPARETTINFNNLFPRTTSKHVAAVAFLKLLALTTNGQLQVQQDVPFEDIFVKRSQNNHNPGHDNEKESEPFLDLYLQDSDEGEPH
eukprot:m.98010 g.98010  ORF g.98010 m.98010 type:complete len:632 (+) comp22073_c0_seq15:181-2076(+)